MRLARALGVTTALTVSIVTVVALPLLLLHGLWRYGYRLLDGRWPVLALPAAFDEAQQVPPLSWQGQWLPAPPGWSWILEQCVLFIAPLLIFLLTLHLLLPLSWRIRNASGLAPHHLSAFSEPQRFVQQLRVASGGPNASVWVLPGDGVRAFALSSPLGAHAIVISQGVLQSLPWPMTAWILAHEYAHVRHGDTRSATLWLLAMGSVYLFDRLRHRLADLLLSTMAQIPLLHLLVAPLLVAVRLLSLCGRAGRRIGTLVFLLFDRWASRHMEFAADRYAALMVGTGPGIALFEGMSGDLEPRFNGLFATHPSHARRVEQLRAIEWAKKSPV